MSPEDKEERAAPHVAVKDPAIFRQEADKLLVKIESALRPMEEYNDVFNITLTPRNHYSSGSLTLELAPEDGMYSLEVEDEGMRIIFQSATSGRYNYVLSASTGEWVDEKDGHSFVGMLVRDLIRQCNGLPDL
jgi:frataxin-like iron-binding protein CyaY